MSSNLQLRLALVGDSGVGKTSFVKRYVDAPFSTNFKATIGIDYEKKTIVINDESVKLVIWDTAGQEKFYSLTPLFCRKADGIVVFYDITDPSSFDNISSWITRVKEQCPQEVQLVLVGNKCDQEGDRKISIDSGMELSKRLKVPFFEASALTNYNIDETFMEIATKIMMKKSLIPIDYGIVDLETPTIEPGSPDNKSKCC